MNLLLLFISRHFWQLVKVLYISALMFVFAQNLSHASLLAVLYKGLFVCQTPVMLLCIFIFPCNFIAKSSMTKGNACWTNCGDYSFKPLFNGT